MSFRFLSFLALVLLVSAQCPIKQNIDNLESGKNSLHIGTFAFVGTDINSQTILYPFKTSFAVPPKLALGKNLSYSSPPTLCFNQRCPRKLERCSFIHQTNWCFNQVFQKSTVVDKTQNQLFCHHKKRLDPRNRLRSFQHELQRNCHISCSVLIGNSKLQSFNHESFSDRLRVQRKVGGHSDFREKTGGKTINN